MKLSTRSTYGMRALVELALTAGHGPLSAALIAKRQELSVAYLEQLLHRLKKHGLVTSIRGPRGGYVLARDPQRITMAEVVRILDGNHGIGNGKGRLTMSRGVSNGRSPTFPPESRRRGAGALRASESQAIQRHAQSIAQAVWQCVHERLAQSLDAVTLQDLCDYVRTETTEPLEHRYVFHI